MPRISTLGWRRVKNDRVSLTLPRLVEADWSAAVRESWQARFAENPDLLKSPKHNQTVVRVHDFEVGGDDFITMAGPTRACALG